MLCPATLLLLDRAVCPRFFKEMDALAIKLGFTLKSLLAMSIYISVLFPRPLASARVHALVMLSRNCLAVPAVK